MLEGRRAMERCGETIRIRIMITGLIIAFACAAVVEQPGTIWIDGPLDGATVSISEAGSYHVWCRVAPGASASVTLGDATLAVEGGDGEDPIWIAAGERELKAGELAVTASDQISAIAMSVDAGFDPAESENLIYALDAKGSERDARFDRVRDTDTVFEMTEFESKADWEAFAENLRRKLLVGSGLWPLPEKTPLNAVVEIFAEHDDYAVARVHFEAAPGFYVTGNLFRPVGDGPFPGVVCPHGHWEHGRLEHGERGSVPARGITLARMGMVAFTYDMLGYNDSMQMDHRFDDQSDEERKRLELWGLHPFALQLWSSIRAVDFMQSLPYVDAENIACTGASGGGTQTFALTGVDNRIKVAAPVNMISHTMQGGCICENAPLIRFNASNMEVGALAAPRPMMLISATGDWTKLTPEVEYPAIRGIYERYDAADRLANVHVDAEHNYNKQSREAVYRFFGRWVLDKGAEFADYTEPEATPEPVEEARVFPDGKAADLKDGKAILADMIAERRQRADAKLPKSAGELNSLRNDFGAALFDVTGVTIPVEDALVVQSDGQKDLRGFSVNGTVIHDKNTGAKIPAVMYRPSGHVDGFIVVVHDGGKAQLADVARSEPGPVVQAFLDKNRAVLAIDVFGVGENAGERKYGRFPTTFMPTDTGYRIQDIVTALAWTRADGGDVEAVVGLGDAGVWAFLASALEGKVPLTIADLNGFDPADDAAWMAKHYLACIQSAGGLDTAAAMIAPRRLAVCNTQSHWSGEAVKPAAGNSLTVDAADWDASQIAGQL
jgi:hypothetical protein